MGNFHNLAIFKHSKNCPLLQVPSPKNAAVTASLLLSLATSFLYLLEKAAPKATGIHSPINAYPPSKCCSLENKCMDPPRPLLQPVDLPKSSLITSNEGTPALSA